MKRYGLLITYVLFGGFVHAQALDSIFCSYGSEIFADELKQIVVSNVDEYVGEYDFGESEAEWTLKLFKNEQGLWDARKFRMAWGSIKEDEPKVLCIVEYFDGLKVNNNSIEIDGVTYIPYIHNSRITNKPTFGLLERQYSSTRNANMYSFGGKCSSANETEDINLPLGEESADRRYIHGQFVIASEYELSEKDLSRYSKEELWLMRNEVFARYGYIFSNEKLNSYFSSKSWYTPCCNDISNRLSSVEKKNILLINKLEKNR